MAAMGTESDQGLDRRDTQLDSLQYVLSHDLLTPLRTMREMARILRQEHERHLPPEAAVFLGHFADGTDKLVHRMDALVRYVRISQRPLDCHRVDIAHLVERTLDQLRAQPGNEHVEVVVGDLPDSMGDAELLGQLFSSVLSNAFKFTRGSNAPRIEIGWRDVDARNAYFVVDNGDGFDMKYAGRLFGLFQRMHSDAQFEGVGAGLAIARRIVERHGGTIRAEGVKGQGTTVQFTLPAVSAEAG
jgi:two-component system sensor kinase